MPYNFGDTQLRVVYSRIAANRDALKSARFLILEHVLPTTVELVSLLQKEGGEVFGFIAKPYSIDDVALQDLKQLGIDPIREENYKKLESSGKLGALLQAAQAASDTDKKKVVIIDVGGYFADPLARSTDLRHVAGVVEDTTFGHNRYKSSMAKIAVPIVSVARSELKEIEARFVGKDAVAAMDLILRDPGVSISGRNALVIGYGMIGKNVARTLRRYDLKVSVYDRKETMCLRAHADGFAVHKKSILLPKAHIIFSATGTEAIEGNPPNAVTYQELVESCHRGVILASVGSRKSEFDIEELRKQRTYEEPLGRGKDKKGESTLVRYTLSNTKQIIVACDGSAVNFYHQSIPIEVLDLVFAEIITSCFRLLQNDATLGIGLVNQSLPRDIDGIAKEWLRLANDE